MPWRSPSRSDSRSYRGRCPIHPSNLAARFVRIGSSHLPGLDPPADEILSELSETAARIVEFFGSFSAAREEGLLESGGARRIGLLKFVGLRRSRFEAAYEREARAVADERSRAERQFDL